VSILISKALSHIHPGCGESRENDLQSLYNGVKQPLCNQEPPTLSPYAAIFLQLIKKWCLFVEVGRSIIEILRRGDFAFTLAFPVFVESEVKLLFAK
jgi:hypothetical protein